MLSVDRLRAGNTAGRTMNESTRLYESTLSLHYAMYAKLAHLGVCTVRPKRLG